VSAKSLISEQPISENLLKLFSMPEKSSQMFSTKKMKGLPL